MAKQITFRAVLTLPDWVVGTDWPFDAEDWVRGALLYGDKHQEFSLHSSGELEVEDVPDEE